MTKTYLYIPDLLNEKINHTAKLQKKSKAEVMRQALENGIETIQQETNASIEVLFKLRELGKKYDVKGPKDSSVNLDYYLWGLPKKDVNKK